MPQINLINGSSRCFGSVVHHTQTISTQATTSDHAQQARSGEEKKYVPTRPKKEEVCGGNGRIGWPGKCQLPEQKRQESRHRKTKLSRLSLIPPTPLSKGLVIDFFGPFFLHRR